MSLAKGVWFADAVMGLTGAVLCVALSSLAALALWGLDLSAWTTFSGIEPTWWKLGLAVAFAALGVYASWHYYGILSGVQQQDVQALGAWLSTKQSASRWSWLLSVTGCIFSASVLWGLV